MRTSTFALVLAAIAVIPAIARAEDGHFRVEASLFGGATRAGDRSLALSTPQNHSFAGFANALYAPDSPSVFGFAVDASYVDGALWIPVGGFGVGFSSSGAPTTNAAGARFSPSSAYLGVLDLPGIGFRARVVEDVTLGVAVRGAAFLYGEQGTVTQGGLTVDAKANVSWAALAGDVRACMGETSALCLSLRPVVLDARGWFGGATFHVGGEW